MFDFSGNISEVVGSMKEWGPGWFDQLYLEQYELLKNCAFRSLGDEMLCDDKRLVVQQGVDVDIAVLCIGENIGFLVDANALPQV